MTHRVAAKNGCHRAVGHQGQWQTLSLLQNWFWWPSMVMEMQEVISGCERCIQHEGIQVKALLQTILATYSLELLHVDFTGIEMTIKLDQPPHIVNVLVFCDHFTRHIMAYVNPDQMAKKLLNFCGRATSQSSEHQPSSWVTEEPPARAKSSASCVSLWAFWRQELHCTTPRPMDRWSKPTKHWWGWLGNLVKIRRQTGWSIYQNWCMLTTPQGWPSLNAACITWCLGDDCICP